MITKKHKPTTPGRRGMITTDYSGLSKTEPFKKLLIRLKSRAGRGSSGRITMRHQGGGEKALYRMIDFKQNKIGVPGRVESLEYDPYRTAFIALVVYNDGERRYIIAPEGLEVGGRVLTSEDTPFVPGTRTSLKRIPVGTFIHNVEINPGKGGSLARSAGSSLEVLANEDGYTHLKMPSGEIRKVLWGCLASIGQVSNPGHNLVVIGKAGRSRRMGIRPTVRASAMNPRDHKYGGGEGRAKRGTKRPKDKWGNITGGRKTRKRKKWSNKLIIKRRK